MRAFSLNTSALVLKLTYTTLGGLILQIGNAAAHRMKNVIWTYLELCGVFNSINPSLAIYVSLELFNHRLLGAGVAISVTWDKTSQTLRHIYICTFIYNYTDAYTGSYIKRDGFHAAHITLDG